MESEPLNFRVPLPDFLDNAGAQVVEDVSQLSRAAEDFVAPQLDKRFAGFAYLEKLQAFEASPVYAYLLVTRLTEPSLELRGMIVDQLAEIIRACLSQSGGQNDVGHVVAYHLSQIRTRQIYALLQLAVQYEDKFSNIALVLKQCSFAGNQLAEIAENRDMPLPIRKQAILFIQHIGYTVAIASLDRLLRRFEMKYPQTVGQRQKSGREESDASLIPLLRETLETLKSS